MADPADSSIPQHIAIILDGNRRWAKHRGLSAKEGHKAGYETLKTTADAAFARGIKYVTAYVFSTENWSRTSDEVSYLMGLVAWVVKEEAQEYHRKGVRIRVFGSEERVEQSLLKGLRSVEKLTEHNTRGTVNLCFNYGGRRDLMEAMRALVAGGIAADEVTEERIAGALSSAGTPDPDLIIRTSGEQRLSNFLIWEAAYSELYFTDMLWPDFDAAALDIALAEYATRKRNFGA